MFKYKMYVFFVFFLTISIFSFINVNANEFPLLNKVIYIDPGHGGADPGTIYKDIYEKDINLELCNKLKDKLESLGAIVYMTRYGDYDLSNNYAISRKKSDLNNRAKIINNSKADIYISIHLNSISSSTWSGAQVFYDDVNEKNKVIAELIQNQLKEDLNTKRKIKELTNMLLNRKVTIPGILIEVGFLSNPNDRYLLQKQYYQKKVINSITIGVLKYFKIK